MNKRSTLALHTGREIPVLGLGSWEVMNDTAAVIEYALHLGYPMIDTSSDYGSQPGIAEGIKSSGIKRDDFYLVTKVEETDAAYDRVKSNLKELELDYADLMLIHRPPKNGAGVRLWEDLIKARNDGLTRDIGVSNYSAKLIDELIKRTNETPVVNQIEWSPFGHDMDMLAYSQDKRILIQAYSPLTRGERLNNKTLKQIADKYGKSPAQVMIRWNLQQGVIPITKADEKDHLKEDIDVFDFELSNKDMKTLSDLNEKYSALGSLPYV